MLNPLNVKSKRSGCEFKYFLLFAWKTFMKTRITREQKKYIFWLIKNEDKIAGHHLKLYFCYIKKEQNVVVMYLELIFTGIKTERWKVAEVSKIAYRGHLGLKQVGKIVWLGIKTRKKRNLCWIWSREKNARAETKVAGERLFI